MTKPKPLDKQIPLDPKKYIVSKTDAKGVITYANKYFIEVCGYSANELIGKPHNMIRHPDMPRAAFKLMWDTIQTGSNFTALVKNLAKDGRYYWVMTEFESKRDKDTNNIILYTAFRKAAPKDAIKKIIPIYKKLCEIEQESGLDASIAFLQKFLEEKNMTYEAFIDSLVAKKGFFRAIKRIFQ